MTPAIRRPSPLQRLLALVAGLWLACLWPGPTRAEEGPLVVEGQPFERHVQVAQTDLLLNGTGVRAVAWFKGYAAALYLTARAGDAAQVTALPGPKRLQIRLLVDVPAKEFAKASRDGIAHNAGSPEAVARLDERVGRFEAQINELVKVHKGDVVDLDYDPARGMLFFVNGTLRGSPITGEDFYNALLRAFVGEQPYDKRLRAGLLGQSR